VKSTSSSASLVCYVTSYS